MMTVELRSQQQPQRQQVAKETGTSGDGTDKKAPVRKKASDRVGRNDPCPCGSGKKYKQCCGRKA
jgi:preprotein translocase subunit SecA